MMARRTRRFVRTLPPLPPAVGEGFYRRWRGYHGAMVSRLLDENSSISAGPGWRAALRAAIGDAALEFRIQPDAWRIEADLVTVFEVAVTHALRTPD